MKLTDNWLIWSNEHRAWWKPGGWGYTKSKAQAGRYHLTEAVKICFGANSYLEDEDPPQETIVQDK